MDGHLLNIHLHLDEENPHQQVEGMLKFLKAVNKLLLSRRFGP